MLIASLPALPARLDVERPVISQERLEGRLRMLEPDDAEEMVRLRAVLKWANQFDEPDDAAVVRRYHALMADIRNPLVRDILEYGTDVRMIAVALRCRRAGRDLPEVGFGSRFGHLRRNFAAPDFKLGAAFPWIADAEQSLGQGDLLGLFRRYVLGATWDYLRKQAQDHYFDFEAVVLYVAQWDCVRRWQQLDEARGREIFESLITEALGEHAILYA